MSHAKPRRFGDTPEEMCGLEKREERKRKLGLHAMEECRGEWDGSFGVGGGRIGPPERVAGGEELLLGLEKGENESERRERGWGVEWGEGERKVRGLVFIPPTLDRVIITRSNVRFVRLFVQFDSNSIIFVLLFSVDWHFDRIVPFFAPGTSWFFS